MDRLEQERGYPRVTMMLVMTEVCFEYVSAPTLVMMLDFHCTMKHIRVYWNFLSPHLSPPLSFPLVFGSSQGLYECSNMESQIYLLCTIFYFKILLVLVCMEYLA